MGQQNDRPGFAEVLAEALERCERSEAPEAVAAEYPEHQLLPYLDLARRLVELGGRRWPTEGRRDAT
jgi:hypothetical protein